jgi:hypothetical protein
MTLLRSAAALLLLVSATPAWSQSAEALAALEVTEPEQAYLAEHSTEIVSQRVDEVMVGLRPMSTMMHDVFDPSLHAEIDATFMAYFESQRPVIQDGMMRALAESMTLEEMDGRGLNTRRSLEISAYVSAEMQALGQRMAVGAIRHLCSVVQHRAQEECGILLDRADQYEALLAG